MTRKAHILQLAPRFPLPLDDGGKIGIFNILREFSKAGHKVTFFSFVDQKPSDALIDEISRYADFKYMIYRPANSVGQILRALLKNDSLYLSKHFNDKIKRHLHDMIDSIDIDVIHADHTAMARAAMYASRKSGKPWALRLHNIEWTIWKRYADSLPAHDPKKYPLYYQAELLRSSELKIIARAKAVFAITETDRQSVLQQVPGSRVLLAGAGADLNEFSPGDPSERNPLEIVHAATFLWQHNTDAVTNFCTNVMPAVRSKVPDCTFKIIGKGIDSRFDQFKSVGVVPVGYVDSAAEIYRKAAVFAAPLFVGGGVRIKILEAMASGLPVVATRRSAEGITAGADDGLFIVDSNAEFADRITELLTDRDMRTRSGAKAREFAEKNFSWQTSVNVMCDEYQSLAGTE